MTDVCPARLNKLVAWRLLGSVEPNAGNTPALRPAPGGPDPPNPPGRLALPSTIRRHHGPVTLSHFANGHRRLDIHDHRMLEIDKVVVGIGVDRRLVGRGCVAGRWIGTQDRLRLNRRRPTS